MQQVPAVDQKTSIFHGHIARHLFHPLLIRTTGDSGQAYPPALQMNEKQHVVRNQPAERKHFHREEVGRHQYRHVSPDKVFPTRRLLPFGSRWNIMAAENVAHRLIDEHDERMANANLPESTTGQKIVERLGEHPVATALLFIVLCWLGVVLWIGAMK